MKASYTGLLARIRGLASRPHGVSYAEALAEGITTRQLCHNGRHMADAGEMHVIGFREERRYFSHIEDAQRYEVELQGIKAAKKQVRTEKRRKSDAKPKAPPKKPQPTQTQRIVLTPPEPAPVRMIAHKVPWDQRPADYSKAKVTVCPSPPLFGAAARLAYAAPAKSLKPLKVGKEI